MAAGVGLRLAGRFLGNAVSESFAFAAGFAIGPVLGPPTQELRNKAWSAYPVVPIDPGTLAEGVAQGQVDPGFAKTMAQSSGISGDNFDHLVEIANVGPGMAAAFDLWRRNLITQDRFEAALKRGGIEDEWIAQLVKTKDILLSPAELANAVVQNHMTQADAAAEADLQGIDADRFDVLVQNTGLPPGPETLMAWWRRGIITTAELEQGIREGHTKTKYIPFYEAARAPVLSAVEYANLRLRDWITKAESDAGGDLTGYTPEQMDLLFKNRGRPATVHQIHIGYARGASVPGAANEEAAIRQSVARSDIRPEYADVLYAQRYSLPSAFVIRGLAQSGAITPDRTHEILIQSGWPPDLAAEVTAAWTGGGTTAAKTDTNVSTAHTQLRTATHRSYIIDKIDRAQADAALAHIIPSPTIRGQVLDTWDVEKTITVKPLTRAAIKKLYTNGTWTLEQAVADLELQGMEEEDATLYLQS